MNTEFIIGLLIGGIFVFIFREVESSLRHRTENKLLKVANEILRGEREERKNRIIQNESDIRELKTKDKEREEQVLLCLELVSKVTQIRNDLDLTTQTAATRLLRVHLKLNENDTYISSE
jgi:hypothetical protein